MEKGENVVKIVSKKAYWLWCKAEADGAKPIPNN